MKILITLIILNLFLACSRTSNVETPVVEMWPGARPAAILQTGEHPLWFMLSLDGPVHIESIEDAVLHTALAPWPYALHIRFLHEREDSLVMAINRDGFLKIMPNEIPDMDEQHSALIMFRFPAGDFFRQYTLGGFVFYGENPIALLYLDRRFLDTTDPPAQYKTWSFNINSNNPFPVRLPAFQQFSHEDGWDIDTLRFGNDGLIYYRAARRTGNSQAVRTFRTASLTQTGEEISTDVFFNSTVQRTEISHPNLPALPENFVYTEIGHVAGSLFAAWEEQADYSIGAAGFVLLLLRKPE
ncbi:MAG: hypothetical protein LBC80_07595 [Treponema sp.]|jgi:hypothetical protein|nr:hypothetical protein [Treponema sp.]